MPKNRLIDILAILFMFFAASLGAEPGIIEEQSIDQVPGGFPVDFSLVTRGNHQYAAYYNSSHQMVIAMRTLGSKSWSKKNIKRRKEQINGLF
ncbi:MAG: hypothetical protein JXR70_04225 [Spirochaetales bacterium]|nr:hypothetical protein [Spirochaetales bacterium]